MILLVFVVILNHCLGQLTGPNICTRIETFTEEVLTSKLTPYQVREFTWCVSSTLRCSKLVTKFKTTYETQRLTKIRPALQCCQGFKENPNKTLCVPKCSNGCINGKCSAPDTCECYPGYGGSTCTFSCPLSLYGKHCEYNCACKNNATCDALDGKCRCSDGWRGVYCEKPCVAGTYGMKCSETCKCTNGACDHVSGSCSCHSGWNGKFCNTIVKKANTSTKICSCLNGGSCTEGLETCTCAPGWDGKQCEKKCDYGNWGINCKQNCSCSNGANCNRITGTCICLPGFSGNKCSNICVQGTYGKDCLFECNCNNNGKCSLVDGICACFEGWLGPTCNISLSVNLVEKLSCKCPNENFICGEDQNCSCREGYEGDLCDVSVTNKWLLYGGIGFGIILFLCMGGILITCILSIKSYKLNNSDELYRRRSSNCGETRCGIEETQLINYDRYLKPRHLRPKVIMNNKTEHFYEEIRTDMTRYSKLNYNGTVNPVNELYQIIKK